MPERPPAPSLRRVVLCVVNAAIVLMAAHHVAPSASAGEQMLSAQRWEGLSYGLSLRPPIGAVAQPWPTSDIRMRYMGSGGYTVDLFIRKKREREDDMMGSSALIVANTAKTTDQFNWQIYTGEGDVTLERVETIAQKAMEVVDPKAVMLDRTDMDPGGRRASVVYFKLSPTTTGLRLPQKTAGDWVIGQAFMQLRRNTFAVLRLQVDHVRLENIRPVFEAMVQSIRVKDPRTLEAQRDDWISRGRMWRELIDHQRLHNSLTAEQYFRIKRDDADIGYMRVRERKTREMDMPGLGVEIMAAVNRGRQVFESQIQMFLSDDAEHEIWSIQTWARPLGPAGRPVAAARPYGNTAWKETGVRSRDRIEIKRDGPAGPQTRTWARPPKGYLSQVETHLMGPHLPHKERQRLAYYAYHPDTGHLTLHTISVVPGQNGSYQVYSRPSLDHPEDVATYDGNGRLLRRDLHGGVVIEAATAQQMRLIWSRRGRNAPAMK